MNKLAIVCFLVGLTAVLAKHLYSEEVYQESFTDFVSKYNKKYTHDGFFYRYNIFKKNFDYIHNHNTHKKTSYTLAVNEFADMKFEEFHASRTGYNMVSREYIRSKNVVELSHIASPQPVDWRDSNAVTPVKDQGQCGSCWSFSATGSMEGAWALKKKQLVSLSEQQLVDCSQKQGNDGCNGGLMDYAFEYVIANGGITTEAKYPYTARDGKCKKPLPPSAVSITKYADVTPNSKADLIAAVEIGPVSIAIEADQEAFQFYSGGVFDDASCGTNLDHGVLAVGYNTTDDGTDYYIVKNSWGQNWGLSGYILMAAKDGAGECGMNMDPSYPIV